MRKPSKKSNQVKVESADVEVLSNAYIGPMSLQATLYAKMNELPARLEKADLKDLSYQIRQYAGQTERYRRETIANGANAIINAWACGTTLNIAKNKLKHGEFGPWLVEELKDTTFNVRTAQRYMNIAKRFSCVEDLLACEASLRQIYISCGILPEACATEKTAEIDREVTARTGLLKSVASVQNKLRRFSGAKNFKIDDETKKELVAAKAEIDQLFEDLIG